MGKKQRSLIWHEYLEKYVFVARGLMLKKREKAIMYGKEIITWHASNPLATMFIRHL